MFNQKTIPVRHRLFRARKVWPWIIGIVFCLLVTGTIGGNWTLIQKLMTTPTTTATVTDTPKPTATATETDAPTATPTKTKVPTLTSTADTATVTSSPTPTVTMTETQTNTPVPTATQPITEPLSADESSRLVGFQSENCPRKPAYLQIRVEFTDATHAKVIANYCTIVVRNEKGLPEYRFGVANTEDDKWIPGNTWIFIVEVVNREIAIKAERSAFNDRNGDPMVEYGAIVGVDYYVHIQVYPTLIPTPTPNP